MDSLLLLCLLGTYFAWHPFHWKIRRTVLLYKKRDVQGVDNYRPICLPFVAYKLTRHAISSVGEELCITQSRKGQTRRSEAHQLLLGALPVEGHPFHWKIRRTVLLYKKRDVQGVDNYRPICLPFVAYKLVTRVILDGNSRTLDCGQPCKQRPETLSHGSSRRQLGGPPANTHWTRAVTDWIPRDVKRTPGAGQGNLQPKYLIARFIKRYRERSSWKRLGKPQQQDSDTVISAANGSKIPTDGRFEADFMLRKSDGRQHSGRGFCYKIPDLLDPLKQYINAITILSDPAASHRKEIVAKLKADYSNVFNVGLETVKDPQLKHVLEFIKSGIWLKKPQNVTSRSLSTQKGCIFVGDRIVIPERLSTTVLQQLREGRPGMTRMKMLARK
ncbi:unnamed protein product [Heligmosomoides polygyrus]|uniref:Doublecortin domain-containing protein n=1 Tax=Heligmosomoides polygyrus TaxID=6339 RepID=A0A183G5R1_HELPZ|nr:unnamed protein product [Heligmosomoides polygyrus]